MDARKAPVSRSTGLKLLAGVAVMGAFFVLFSLAGGLRPRSTLPTEEASGPDALPELRARLADAVKRLHDPAAARGQAVRDVLDIAREQLPAAAGEAFARQGAGLAELARDPTTAGAPFARKAERLLDLVDACLETGSGEPLIR